MSQANFSEDELLAVVRDSAARWVKDFPEDFELKGTMSGRWDVAKLKSQMVALNGTACNFEDGDKRKQIAWQFELLPAADKQRLLDQALSPFDVLSPPAAS